MFDSSKARGKNFGRYLKPLLNGELLVKARGKEIVYAAGLWPVRLHQHAVRVHFGLEGTMAVIPTEAFMDMISRDCPGSNKDKKKAASMRSFIVPEQLTVRGARSTAGMGPTMVIFAALVGKEHTLVMVDHNRLLRIHLMSRSKPWTADDFTPHSKSWAYLWSDNHGPDWIYERDNAEQRLDLWRDTILTGHRAGLSVSIPPSILDVMCSNQDVFNGYGQHTAHDLLHKLGIWPGMTPYSLCTDDTKYDHFKRALHEYAQQYQSPPYRARCLGVPNHPSALTYNYKSDDNYHMHYLLVYRKSTVRMSREDYNSFAKQGLFNPSHVIGEPYSFKDIELISVAYRDVAIYQYSRSGKDPIYSVISARPPAHWKYGGDDVTQILARDARSAGFSTTLGPASFHMFKNNQYDWTTNNEPGRKAKVHPDFYLLSPAS
ncbi:hypothetical protein BN946_scf184912.g26 [Trametes cinnabarina]|uniref:Uncharacterized protein n=1 Tax=Pycnoporus cinnabarinus TaxID=5643 RepID=A0A060SSK8_PYCCI|nr:hypothetical protein BN946_scf184912.g26 [Trametes cinnabarina]